jgi:Tfp pilus assembly protein PilO
MTDFRKKVLISLGISLGIIIVICVLIAVVFGDFKAVGESIENITLTRVTKTQAISSLNLLKQDAEEAKIMANKLSNALPLREALFSFSEEMNRLARDMGLTSSFTFGNEIASGSASAPSKAEFVMNVSGGYEQVLAFMNAFEASRYFTRIKTLEFVSQGINTSAYQVIFSGEVFFSN